MELATIPGVRMIWLLAVIDTRLDADPRAMAGRPLRETE
jgi:hypothetical protein